MIPVPESLGTLKAGGTLRSFGVRSFLVSPSESRPEQTGAASREAANANPQKKPSSRPSGSFSSDNISLGGDTHDLAIGLAPAMRDMCDGKLGDIEWFRSTWQRGGAATGFSTWELSDGSRVNVIVKLPVGPREYAWTVGLGAVESDAWHTKEAMLLPVPRVVAASEMLGGHDLAWFVIERLEGPTLNHTISSSTIKELCQTAAEFHSLASMLRDVHGQGEDRNWESLIEKSRKNLAYTTMPNVQGWRNALKKLHKSLGRVLRVWNDRPRDTWCHGDLHPGNAMRRACPTQPTSDHEPQAAPDETGTGGGARGRGGGGAGGGSASHPTEDAGRCVLLDLAFVHPGHWVEDAIYIERQFWAHPALLGKSKPVSLMGRHRRTLGLASRGDHTRLASARRVLMAGCAPAWWDTEGSPAYGRGALQILETHLEKFLK